MMSVSSDSTSFGVGIHTERLALQERAVPHSAFWALQILQKIPGMQERKV